MSLSFNKLYSEHPSIKEEDHKPCTGKFDHVNQCAIRLGVTLQRCGVSMESYTGSFCYNNHKKQHPIRAIQMGRWLARNEKTFGKVEITKASKKSPIKESKYAQRTGILLCIQFKGVDDPNAYFNHIDLWDGLQASGYRFAHGNDAWVARSSEVWFWEIK